MQKYKVTATKSQKKYTLIISAESEEVVKEKIHKQGYTILKIEDFGDNLSNGKRFVFQAEKNGEIQNGIMIGDDIFKVYKKLRTDLGYHVLVLYPENDVSYYSAESKQQLISKLEKGYELQKGNNILQEEKGEENDESEDKFYLQKELSSVNELIAKTIEKFEELFSNYKVYNINEEKLRKLKDIYTKIVYVKNSHNIIKLREIGELGLVKLAQVQLEGLEENKNIESKKFLDETNILLKKIGSKQQFYEPKNDIFAFIEVTVQDIKEAFGGMEIKKIFQKNEKKKLDLESYDYLKLVLLLEKYEKKLQENKKEMFQHIMLFLNPFSKSELKEKIQLKSRVIKQNIAILKAKKSGHMSSYTSVKKGFLKTQETIINFLKMVEYFTLIFLVFYFLIFLLSLLPFFSFDIQSQYFIYLFLFYLLLFITQSRRHIFFLWIYIVFFVFSYIVLRVNF